MDKIDIKPDWVFSPQPMYIIGTRNEDQSANFCIITWIGFSFDKTPHLMMTIGGSKLTKSNILRERRFSANLITKDMIWLADYFGCSKGEEAAKDQVEYQYQWGHALEVPVLEQSNWVYECEVDQVIELDGSHLFLAEIKNIQIDQQFEMMDLENIDLLQLNPAIYAPYGYFSIGDKLGSMGEWQSHIKKLGESKEYDK